MVNKKQMMRMKDLISPSSGCLKYLHCYMSFRVGLERNFNYETL